MLKNMQNNVGFIQHPLDGIGKFQYNYNMRKV